LGNKKPGEAHHLSGWSASLVRDVFRLINFGRKINEKLPVYIFNFDMQAMAPISKYRE
jgi:hypothetical protein